MKNLNQLRDEFLRLTVFRSSFEEIYENNTTLWEYEQHGKQPVEVVIGYYYWEEPVLYTFKRLVEGKQVDLTEESLRDVFENENIHSVKAETNRMTFQAKYENETFEVVRSKKEE